MAALAAWVAAFPLVLRGAESVVTPAQAHAMLDHILEMQPVRGLGNVVLYLGGGLAATGLLAWIAWCRREPAAGLRRPRGAFAVAEGALHVRFAT